MIWHIFKKDWKLQWKFAAVIALLQLSNATVLVRLGAFADSLSLRSAWQLLTFATMVGIPFLIAAIVHQDAIPGVRQDWLVRPIQRRDLLLAKFLFILISVHGPMLLADLFRNLANGFAFGPSLVSAASRGLFVLLAFSVPLFALMSLTRNTMEAIAATLIAFLCFAGFGMLGGRSLAHQVVLGASGIAWIENAAMILIGLAGAMAVLSLQYFRRRTMTARGLAAGAGVLVALCAFTPWNAAFALEQRMSPNPGAASAVVVAFDPSIGTARSFMAGGSEADYAYVYLPLRFDSLPDDSALISDSAEALVTNAGRVSESLGSGSIVVRQWTRNEKPQRYLQIYVPGDVYRRLEDQPRQLEIHLSLTLFRSQGSHTIPAVNGSTRLPEWGGCVTRINAPETAVYLGCVPLEGLPSCFALQLRHIPSGRTNPSEFQCQGDYAPFFGELFVLPSDPRGVPFRDLSGLAKYPVSGPDIRESQVVIETYKPVDHFTRTVVIPVTRLKDWTAQ